MENKTTYGLSIHPDNANICSSAIVDGVIPLHGGVFQVTALPPLSQYNFKDPLIQDKYEFNSVVANEVT